MEHPNADKHFRYSLFKSILRIIGSTALIFNGVSIAVAIAGILFLVAEIFGIVEELV